MNAITYIVVDINSQTVVAHFFYSEDCAQYVRFHDHTIQIPFNSANHEVPALGSKYVA